MGEVGFVGRLIFHDGGNVIATKLFFDFGEAIPAAERAKTFFVELFGEQMGGTGTYKRFRGLQFGDESFGG